MHFTFYGLSSEVKNISQYDESSLFSIGICMISNIPKLIYLPFLSTQTQQYFHELCMTHNHSATTTYTTLNPNDLPPKNLMHNLLPIFSSKFTYTYLWPHKTLNLSRILFDLYLLSYSNIQHWIQIQNKSLNISSMITIHGCGCQLNIHHPC